MGSKSASKLESLKPADWQLALVALLGTEIEAYLWLIVVVGLLATALIVFSTVLIRRRTFAGASSA
jgi:hypothetical protein